MLVTPFANRVCSVPGGLEFLRDQLVLQVQPVEQCPWDDVAPRRVELVGQSA